MSRHLYSHLCKISPTLSDMLLLIALSEKGTLAETGPAMIATTFLCFFARVSPLTRLQFNHQTVSQHSRQIFHLQFRSSAPLKDTRFLSGGMFAYRVHPQLFWHRASIAKKGRKSHYLAPSNNLILKTFVQKQHWFMKDFLLGQTSTKTTYTEFIFHFLCSCVRKHNARSKAKKEKPLLLWGFADEIPGNLRKH